MNGLDGGDASSELAFFEEIVTVVVDMAACVAFASVIYVFVETPMNVFLRKRWLHQKRPLAHAVAAESIHC